MSSRTTNLNLEKPANTDYVDVDVINSNSDKIDTFAGQVLNGDYVQDSNYVHTDNNFTSTLKNKLDGVEANANNYSLPTASTGTLGGVKVDGSTITIDSNGIISSTGGGGGGTTVIANPSGTATAALEKLQVGQTIYSSGGTTVIGNPSGTATTDLEKIQIGNSVYNIPIGSIVEGNPVVFVPNGTTYTVSITRNGNSGASISTIQYVNGVQTSSSSVNVSRGGSAEDSMNLNFQYFTDGLYVKSKTNSIKFGKVIAGTNGILLTCNPQDSAQTYELAEGNASPSVNTLQTLGIDNELYQLPSDGSITPTGTDYVCSVPVATGMWNSYALVTQYVNGVMTAQDALTYAKLATGTSNITVGNVKCERTTATGVSKYVFTALTDSVECNGNIYNTNDVIAECNVTTYPTVEFSTKASEVTISSPSSLSGLSDVSLSSLTNGQVLKYNSTTEEWENADESGGGTTVIANPSGSATAGNLNKLQVGEDIYSVSGGSGSTVEWTQITESGTKIAEIEIDGVSTDVYAPTSSGGGGITYDKGYSTTETSVCAWTDGTTVYQKTFYIAGDGSTKTFTENTGITNGKKLVQALVSGVRHDTGEHFSQNYINIDDPTWSTSFVMNSALTQFTITAKKYAIEDIIVTLRYLKTTDVPFSGILPIDELSDVDISNPTNGQVLAYNSTTGNWENANGGGGSQEITPISTTDYANLTPQQKSNGQVYLVSPTPISPDYTASNWQFASEYASAYAASIDDGKLVFKVLSGGGSYNSYACAMYKTGIDLTNVDHITLIANITYIGSPREIQIGVIDTLPSSYTYNPTFSSYETLTEGSWTLPIDKTIELDTSALTGTYYFGVKASGKTEFTAESILFYFDDSNIPNEIYHMNKKFSQYPTSGGTSALDDLTDVNINYGTLGDLNVLQYDSGTAKWANAEIPRNLASQGDVTISSATNGQVLKYNSTSNKWENSNESGGTTVVANPQETATEELTTIQIGETVYSLPSGEQLIDLIPRMSSDTTPSGECSASYVYSGRYAYYGFTTDGRGDMHSASQFWYNAGSNANEYIQYDFGRTVTVHSILFGSADSSTVGGSRGVKPQFSMDGTTWVDDETISLSTYEYAEYELFEPRVCQSMRLVCTTAMQYTLSGIQAKGVVGGSTGGSGGHTILNDAGIALSQEDNLQFKGVYSHDDSTNEKTVVEVTRTMTLAQYQALSSDEKKGVIAVTDDSPAQYFTDVVGTLAAGATSITLSDASITANSTIDLYTDTYGVNPASVSVSIGSVTLTFPAQQTAVEVKVRVS